jgi:ankyrin repeat protein
MRADFEQAARSGDADRLGRLLDTGVDIDALDKHGQTALMLAARAGHAEVVRLLVDRGASLDHTAKFRLSALMLAVINGHSAVVETLVEAGADQTLRGSGAPGFFDKSALDLARERGHEVMVALLSQ